MKERTQGKAKLHIIRDDRRMGKIDKAIRCMNRPGYDPDRERRKLMEHERSRPSPRPHAVPCGCRCCYCWDMWQEIDRENPAAVDTLGDVKPQSPQV